MSERVPVFDRWGNYVGYFTEAPGCGPYGWVALILLIVPLVFVFYIVNVIRIGKRLLEKGERKKAALWFGYPSSVVVAYLGGALFDTLDVDTSQVTMSGPMEGVLVVLSCLLLLLAVTWLLAFYVQLHLCFKYSDLDF